MDARRPTRRRERFRTTRGPSRATAFATDDAGAAAVEFALVAVPFLGLLLAIFQVGLTFLVSENLQAAVQVAARNFYVGTAQGNGVNSAAAFLDRYLCPSTGASPLASFIDCSKLIVDVRTATAVGFGGVDTAADFYGAGATTTFCPGGPGDIVVVRVLYPMPVVVPVPTTTTGRDLELVRFGAVNDVPGASGAWRQLLLGTAVFRNEPFSNGYTAPTGC